MRTHALRKIGVVLLAAAFLAATAGVASSVTYTLRVAADNAVMPDNAVIPVWKIANAGTDNVLGFPGPTLVGTVGDDLVVTLINELPSDNTVIGTGNGISLVIPGLGMPVVENPPGTPLAQQGPVFVTPVVDNVSLPPRVVSFTQMTPADNGTRTYRFTLSKSGTFLYQSGADPSVQVQMGIYGALIVRPADPAQAYPPTATNPNTTFDNELVLLYSAIDPFLHNAVVDNTYGTDVLPTTFEYEPKYFLVNGKPYQNQVDPLVNHHDPLPIGPPGGNGTLLRFLNADLNAHAPSFMNTYVSVIGEDGNLLPYPGRHHTVFLPPGKTKDVLLVPSAPAKKVPVVDRRLYVNNNGAYPGGYLTFLGVQGADVTGPVTAPASFDPSSGISPVVLAATADDSATGNSNVVAAEWISDKTVREGYGNPMTGTFGTAAVSDLAAYVPTSAIPADNTIWIRSQDSEGNWSPPVPVTSAVVGATTPLAIVSTDFVGGERLIVRATSGAAAGTDSMTVTWPGASAPVPLVYRSGLDLYEAEVMRLPAKPDTVTVTGAGGSATAPVPFP
ncbi:MAG: multicopper oxidase domain-containing protein [Deltaproteobacteria bacterium]|nr:multicopper oxidase domain-containing protein [Deltaproteobacteria bacterium]